jgi:ribose transport system substrate-binding protein
LRFKQKFKRRKEMKKSFLYILMAAALLLGACAPAAPTEVTVPTSESVAVPTQSAPAAGAYTLPEGALVQPVPLAAGAQFTGTPAYKPGAKARIAYMPPVINPYYGAIEQGAKAQADALGVEMVTFSPSGDSDIAGQMKQLQDVATQGFDAVILSTHDENAAGPLVKRLGEAGIPVVIFNSDIANFPAQVSGVVGYAQRKATHALGDAIAKKFNGKAMVGVLEGQAGYHSTERIGGFLDAFKPFPDMKIVASLPTTWDADTANKATLDMMQAHPEINLIVAANDFEAIGAAKALKGLNRSDVEVYGNDGATEGLEQIAAGAWQGTSNTVPFTMGQITMQVTVDVLNGKYPGGYLETPAIQTFTADVARFLCHPESLAPAPAKTYACP